MTRSAKEDTVRLTSQMDDSSEFANDHDNQIDNQSSTTPFNDFVRFDIQRRNVLKSGVAAAVTMFASSFNHTQSAYANEITSENSDVGAKSSHINFTPVTVSEGSGPTPSISPDYQFDVLIPWGEPLDPAGPNFNYPPTAKEQAEQIGIGHDGMAFFPRNLFGHKSNRHGLLAINHEFGTAKHVLGKSAPESLQDVRTVQHAHGVSIVGITRDRSGSGWKTYGSRQARRIHANTPVKFSGPVADSDLLKTPNGNVALGTLNNCSNGVTPWGTYLTCEENFNGYFGASNKKSTWTATPAQARYGFSKTGFEHNWHLFDRRFDLSDPGYRNEENRFGWVVEIDPYDATQTPTKRTALGRFKHEGVAIVEGQDGRIVAYMGDDQRFDYIYKFVSNRNWRDMRRQGVSPLDEGSLFVARFNEDGSGEWIELSINNPVLAERFSSQEQVLTFARIAADSVRATPMDRPEWTAVAPNGDVYCTLTNNKKRTKPDAANPLAPNNDGHIIRWHDTDNHVGQKFQWELFLIAQDTHGTENALSDPDGLMVDPDGRVFILTDGGQQDGLNNQLLVTDGSGKDIRRLFTGVSGCEITGVTTTPDRRTLFVNVQHPGNGDPAVTNFPAPQDGVTVPRDCTIVITRKDGGIVGS